jgi:hypothetical protein
MKKTFIIIFLVFIPGMIWAQQTESARKTDSAIQTRPAREGRVLTFRDLDQRKIYRWGNGQKATPSGREAGERLGKYVRVFGDSAIVVKEPRTGSETTKK